MKASWHDAFELVLITDGIGDSARLARIVSAAVEGGLRAVQVREKNRSTAEQAQICRTLRSILSPVDGVLIANGAIEVALTQADGIHLGEGGMSPSAARAVLGADALIGYSAHNSDEVEWAVAEGVDYVSLSPVLATDCKPGADGLGVVAAGGLAAKCRVPAVWLGGINVETVRDVVQMRPFGVAAMSALCSAPDPRLVAQQMLRSLREGGR